MYRWPLQHSLSANLRKLGLSLLLLATVIVIGPANAAPQNEKPNSKTSAASASSENADSANQTVPSQPDGSPSGNAANGKKLFMSDGCFECHGTVGQGSTSTGGARIGPPTISFEAMVQYIHHPSGQMPPYTSKVISDQNLADIYAYLRSQPQPPPTKNIPVLSQ